MKSKKINSRKVFYTLAILFVLTAIVAMLVIMCPNSSKDIEGKLILADMNPIVYDQSTHTIEGTIPPAATLKIGEEIIETSGEFEHPVKLNKSPSFTTTTVQMLDKKGNVIQEEKVTVENVRRLSIWLQQDNLNWKVNGTEYKLSAPPTNVNGSMMLPFRDISEAFGAEITWIAETKTIVMESDDAQLKMAIGSSIAEINGGEIELTVPITVINDSTMVPIRSIAEAFGAEVKWNEEDGSVTITQEIHP